MIPIASLPHCAVRGQLERARLGTWRQNWMTFEADRSAIILLLREVAARDVVEIGVHEGWTAKAVLENIPEIVRYRGIDVPLTYIPTLPQQSLEVPSAPGVMVQNDPRFELIIRPRGSLDMVEDDLKCDAMLIDGDHSRAAVVSDTKIALTNARKLIMWHDYGYVDDVTNVLNEMFSVGFPLKHASGTILVFLLNVAESERAPWR